MITVAVFDSKSYDRDSFRALPGVSGIRWRFHEHRLNRETAPTAAGARVVCAFVNDQLDRECLRELKKQGVGLIALRCAGFNNIDLEAARKLRFSVVRVPAYSPHAVAEHTVALFLALNRKIPRAHNRVRDHNFSLSGLVGFDVFGKTIGILGTGKIGRIVAQIFRGFEARVMAFDTEPDQAWADQHGVIYNDLKTLLGESDVISLHVPLTPGTEHLIRTKTIRSMKRGVILINTGRGKLIDTAALIIGLKREWIGGVALDVYEEEEGVFFEDLSDRVLQDDVLSRLLTFPNVLITSHQAFLTREALLEIGSVTTRNVLQYSGGKPFLDGTVLV